MARDLDEVQYETKAGPCLDALRDQRAVNAVFGEDAARWPTFEAAAVARGLGSILSLPLLAGDEALGALNIYSRDSAAYDESEQTTASMLAQQAAAVLANAVAFGDATAANSELLTALETATSSARPKASSWPEKAATLTAPSTSCAGRHSG